MQLSLKIGELKQNLVLVIQVGPYVGFSCRHSDTYLLVPLSV